MKRSIYSLIHGNLKKMLAVTLGVSAILLLFYTVFSFKQTENEAARFVMNHVERLAQAGVISQSVGDVDHEVVRFAQTWKETEDLDLRIDIFLNDKHISHAGQLQPFGYLSTLTDKRLRLPSGDTLRVLIQMDLTGFVLYSALLLAVLEGAIIILFYILSKSMQTSIRAISQPLESKVAWLKEVARNLPASARAHASFVPAHITEIDDLGESIESLTQQIVALEDNLATLNYDRGRLKMAEQVAHSIKGAIATLQLRTKEIADESERRGLLDCIKTLSDISGNLLKSKRTQSRGTAAVSPGDPTHLLPVIRSAVAVKCEQYREYPGVVIQLTGQAEILGRFANMESTDLQTVLFNLIDNSVEALGPAGGQVNIETRSFNDHIELIVRDNGCGIPKHVLPSLMIEGFSYGKENGNGIGLSHAKEILQGASGTMTLCSEEGVGTTVSIRMPLVKPAHMDIEAVTLPAGGTVVCIDDDPHVHSVWDNRLQDASGEAIAVVHLRSASEFEDWIAANGTGRFGTRLYLFDFELQDGERTGLDLITEYGLALECILVSGMIEDADVKARTTRMGLRRLSKDFLDVVPILVEGQVPLGDPGVIQAV